MKTKSILQSRTFWVNVIAFLLLFLPAVQAWLQENPKSGFSILAALNLVLRTLTSSGIDIFASGGATKEEASGGMVPGWFGIAVAGSLCIGSLPSCSPAQVEAFRGLPINGAVVTDYGTAAYSSKSGISVVVDRRSGK
jgi:hypothetical protein